MSDETIFPGYDDSQDPPDGLAFSTGAYRPPGPQVDSPQENSPVDPQAMVPFVDQRLTAWDSTTPRARDIVGPGDCWCAEVLYAYDATADAVTGEKGAIDVQRVRPTWDSNGDFVLDDLIPAGGQPEPPAFFAGADEPDPPGR